MPRRKQKTIRRPRKNNTLRKTRKKRIVQKGGLTVTENGRTIYNSADGGYQAEGQDDRVADLDYDGHCINCYGTGKYVAAPNGNAKIECDGCDSGSGDCTEVIGLKKLCEVAPRTMPVAPTLTKNVNRVGEDTIEKSLFTDAYKIGATNRTLNTLQDIVDWFSDAIHHDFNNYKDKLEQKKINGDEDVYNSFAQAAILAQEANDNWDIIDANSKFESAKYLVESKLYLMCHCKATYNGDLKSDLEAIVNAYHLIARADSSFNSRVEWFQTNYASELASGKYKFTESQLNSPELMMQATQSKVDSINDADESAQRTGTSDMNQFTPAVASSERSSQIQLSDDLYNDNMYSCHDGDSNSSCATCESVRQVYADKGWAFDPCKVTQCVCEGQCKGTPAENAKCPLGESQGTKSAHTQSVVADLETELDQYVKQATTDANDYKQTGDTSWQTSEKINIDKAENIEQEINKAQSGGARFKKKGKSVRKPKTKRSNKAKLTRKKHRKNHKRTIRKR